MIGFGRVCRLSGYDTYCRKQQQWKQGHDPAGIALEIATCFSGAGTHRCRWDSSVPGFGISVAIESSGTDLFLPQAVRNAGSCKDRGARTVGAW
jgi:hypothetical protein